MVVNDVQRFTTSVEKIHTTYISELNVKEPDEVLANEHLQGDVF